MLRGMNEIKSKCLSLSIRCKFTLVRQKVVTVAAALRNLEYLYATNNLRDAYISLFKPIQLHSRRQDSLYDKTSL